MQENKSEYLLLNTVNYVLLLRYL